MEFRKSVLALLACGLTSTAFAGGYMPAPSCTNHPVTVPCERSAWDVGVAAFWGRAYSNHMIVDLNDTASEEPTAIYIRPDNKFGWAVQGSYHWGTGNDFTVSWMHYNKTTAETGDLIDATQDDDADGFYNDAKFKFDAVNFELGQHIDVGPSWDLRAHIGAQYVKIDRELNYAFGDTAVVFADGTYGLETYSSDFKGFGPRAGLDAAYQLGEGFSIFGKTAVSLIVGESHASNLSQTIIDEVSIDPVNTQFGERDAMVVGVDGKLGLAYTHNMSMGSVTLAGGYAASAYMNPLVGTSFDTPGTEENNSTFGLGGFFVALKYVS